MSASTPPHGRLLAWLLAWLLLLVVLPSPVARATGGLDLEARYDVELHLDWDTRWVRVKTTIAIVNPGAGPVERLELNAAPAALSGLRGLRVTIDGAPASASVRGQTISVPLGGGLPAGATTTLEVAYRARLGTSAADRGYYFARLGGVAQLYRVIPWLSRRIPFGSGDHGEPFLTSSSPRVEVTVSSDRRLVWATSGRRVARHDERTFTYLARDVRDFNLAASPGWRTVRGRSRDGETAIFAHTTRADGRRLVSLARRELARYERLTGVPYPHPTYRIAETGGGLAMESPALTWIPASRGAADHPYLVSHETAHQWWYSTVGNDQSTDAFADEALADYFARRAHLSLRPSRCRSDRLDREIRAYSDVCYFEVIYIQGARFLDRLRRDFGGRAFRAAIRAYTQGNRGGIGSNSRLLEALRAQMGDGVLPRYQRRFPSLY